MSINKAAIAIKQSVSKTHYNLNKLISSVSDEHQQTAKMWLAFEQSLIDCNDENELRNIIKQHFFFSSTERGTNSGVTRFINRFKKEVESC